MDDIAQSEERIFMLRKIVRNTTFAIMTMAWLLNSISINNTTVHATVQHAGQSTTNNISSDIRVFVDDQQIHFEDQQPIIVDGRTLVPIRGVFEHMGFTAEWIDATRTAMLEGPGHSITIPVDELTFIVQRSADFGVPHTITPDVPQQIINGRTMLPLRAVSEAIGVGVEWDGDNRMVLIDTMGENDGNGVAAATPSVVAPEPSLEQPVDEVSPASVVDGFVDINGIRPIELTNQEWVDLRTSTMISSTLPNRRLSDIERQAWIYEYNALGGATLFELELTRRVNKLRDEHGLNQLVICQQLFQAARFHAQILRDTGFVSSSSSGMTPHRWGPYGGSNHASFAFGATMWGGAATGHGTPELAMTAWIGSSAHLQQLLNPEVTTIGVGAVGAWNYLITGNNSDSRL